MMVKEVLDFNKLCPKDWGKYDPKKPLFMDKLNNLEKDNDEISE